MKPSKAQIEKVQNHFIKQDRGNIAAILPEIINTLDEHGLFNISFDTFFQIAMTDMENTLNEFSGLDWDMRGDYFGSVLEAFKKLKQEVGRHG